MDQAKNNPASPANRTVAERVSDRELVVRRSFAAPVRILFEAWTRPELFKQWWVPKSFGLTLLSCEMDVRVGGKYRLEFGIPNSDQPMAFFGSYIAVIPDALVAWTNEESQDGATTTVTFEEVNGRTNLVIHDLFPSKEALDSEIASGATSGMSETLAQLEAFIGDMLRS
jgi:uncharacterized protein YndB with AHSA1/START domain